MPTALPMLNLHCPREVTLVEAKVVMFVLTTTEFLELKHKQELQEKEEIYKKELEIYKKGLQRDEDLRKELQEKDQEILELKKQLGQVKRKCTTLAQPMS